MILVWACPFKWAYHVLTKTIIIMFTIYIHETESYEIWINKEAWNCIIIQTSPRKINDPIFNIWS